MNDLISLDIWLIAASIALLAGIVKGLVGFAMPMIIVSGVGSFSGPEVALAALLLPTLVANIQQAAHGGFANAVKAMSEYRLYLGMVLVMIALSAQLVPLVPKDLFFLLIGVPITVLATLQLAGWRPNIAGRENKTLEAVTGLFAGFMGGISGMWGVPTTMYLTAAGTPKQKQMQIQGVVYGLGAVVLVGAHIVSGLLNAPAAKFSAAMVIPAVAGMYLGLKFQDRLDQARFRQITLVVLVIAGLNLIRRGIWI